MKPLRQLTQIVRENLYSVFGPGDSNVKTFLVGQNRAVAFGMDQGAVSGGALSLVGRDGIAVVPVFKMR